MATQFEELNIVDDKALTSEFTSGPVFETTPSTLSSEEGSNVLSDKEATLEKLSPTTEEGILQEEMESLKQQTEEVKKVAAERDVPPSIVFTHPEDGRESEIFNPDINRAAIQNLISAGFTMTEAKGAIPSFLTVNADGTSSVAEQSQEDKLLEETRADLESAKEKLFSIDATNDPRFKAIADTIAAQWDIRIRQMEQTNKSRQAALQQANIRLGSRYTGLISGGIMTEEERQGLERVSGLEATKQSAILQAQEAFEAKEWTKFAKAVDLAEDEYERQLEAISELNKQIKKQNEKINAEDRAFKLDSAIADIFSITTDRSAIFSMLQERGFKPTLKEIDEALEILEMSGGADDFTGTSVAFRTFKQFFPEADVTTPEGRQEFFDFIRRESAAGRAPTEFKPTENERENLSVANFAAVFVPGATLEDGSPIIEVSGFISPRAWKEAIADAPLEGLSRKSFIEAFGYLIDTTDKEAAKTKYSLTPTELKLITGEL